MKKLALFIALALPPLAYAGQPFSGTDYSGVYDCTGDDAKEGKYTGIVTLQLNNEQSSGAYGAYDFKLVVPDYGTYPGQAVSLGKTLAIHFALTDSRSKDYGTGIATVATNKKGKLSFHKFYYEPEFKGGNHGFEDCVRRLGGEASASVK
jgi:hypothetical protein